MCVAQVPLALRELGETRQELPLFAMSYGGPVYKLGRRQTKSRYLEHLGPRGLGSSPSRHKSCREVLAEVESHCRHNAMLFRSADRRKDRKLHFDEFKKLVKLRAPPDEGARPEAQLRSWFDSLATRAPGTTRAHAAIGMPEFFAFSLREAPATQGRTWCTATPCTLLPLQGTLLIWCTVCGTGPPQGRRRHRLLDRRPAHAGRPRGHTWCTPTPCTFHTMCTAEPMHHHMCGTGRPRAHGHCGGAQAPRAFGFGPARSTG